MLFHNLAHISEKYDLIFISILRDIISGQGIKFPLNLEVTGSGTELDEDADQIRVGGGLRSSSAFVKY